MNKNLAKLILSTARVSAMSSSLSAQQSQNKATPPAPFEQGSGMNGNQFPPAYSAAARIDVQRGWDFFFTSSFTYWYVNEIAFDLGYTIETSPRYYTFQNNEYSPGFKVGIGMDFGPDDWVGFAEYTWLRNHSASSASFSSEFFGSDLLFFNPESYTTSRHINLDVIDLTLSRPLYRGRDLTLLPFFGFRGGWTRQSFRAYTPLGDSHANTHSWFIGPSAGLSGHWLVGLGFRLQGDLGAALLYQQAKTGVRFDTFEEPLFSAARRDLFAPVANLGLGFGWGAYLNHKKTHLDFAATYDFINWGGQNLMRSLSGDGNGRIDPQPGDLQINGLTITGRFDF